jgi:formylglycine-generating enzyme required for sulfatase activity
MNIGRLGQGLGRLGNNVTNTGLVCPLGYVKVPGNPLYGTSDFCVMKYEAKAVAISDPTVGLTTPNTGSNTIANNVTATTAANGRMIASVASGYPIANINQATAAQYCIDAGGSLMTNAEWMTIVRNIESVDSNWTGGTVGSGGLWRGHSDGTPNHALVASTDNDPYAGTGNTAPSIERRTHTLSNGEVIWDIGGNVWEWTNDTITGANQPTITASPGFNWRQFTALTTNGTLDYDEYRPSNATWNSSQNTGQIYSDGTPGNNTVYGFLRGGGWFSTSGTGVFALFLANTPTTTGNYFGFRCVVR